MKKVVVIFTAVLSLTILMVFFVGILRVHVIFLNKIGIDTRHVNPLSKAQIEKFLKDNKITLVTSADINEQTYIMYEKAHRVGIVSVSSNDLGQVHQMGNLEYFIDNREAADWGVRGGGTNDSQYCYVHFYLNNSVLKDKAHEIKVTLADKSVVSKFFNGQAGAIVPVPRTKIHDIPEGYKILDKSGKVLQEMIRNGNEVKTKSYF